MRRFALLAVILFAVLPALAAVDEVSLPVTPFVFDHQQGISLGLNLHLTNGLGFSVQGMFGRTNTVDGVTNEEHLEGSSNLLLHGHEEDVDTFHVNSRSVKGIAFTFHIPVWKLNK